ncbi:MAG: hypothetical protein IT168_13665 [Bryobacterales bacterium]|nr:hypothetical protein [Bryobacterales bacterium]
MNSAAADAQSKPIAKKRWFHFGRKYLQSALPRYTLAIRPGLLEDGTFGIYALPGKNPTVEYQIEAQHRSIEEAMEVALEYLNAGGERFAGTKVDVSTTRDALWRRLGQTEEFHREALKADIKRSWPTLNEIKWKTALFGRVSTSPYTIAVLGLMVFWKAWSVTIPAEGVPILSEFLGGKIFGRPEAAFWLPFALLFAAAYRHVSARLQCLANARMREHVLALALEHKWTRERFLTTIVAIIEESGYGWAMQAMRFAFERSRTVPMSDAQVALTLQEVERTPEVLRAARMRMVAAEYEIRIHALLYMEAESTFRSWCVLIPPLMFLMETSQTEERLTTLEKKGRRELCELPLKWLPGCEMPLALRWITPVLQVPHVALMVWALLWASQLAGLSGVWRYLHPLTAMPAVLAGPIWNIRMAFRRGIPAGMTLKGACGDPPIIRGL